MAEWRVVHVGSVGAKKYDPFRDFGEDEWGARRFMDDGAFLCSTGGTKRLETRPDGGGPKEWVEVPVTGNTAG